jgi:hypothetical protein
MNIAYVPITKPHELGKATMYCNGNEIGTVLATINEIVGYMEIPVSSVHRSTLPEDWRKND